MKGWRSASAPVNGAMKGVFAAVASGSATTPVGVQCNPARAFARAFANVDMSGGAQEAERRRLFRKKSALDLVRDSFRELRTGLNTADQRRLDEHAARVRQIEIDIVHGDRSPKHVPIYIAATTGMKMMELAGEIGDGVVLNYLVGPAYNREAMAHLAAGAELGGRTVDDVDRPQLVVSDA